MKYVVLILDGASGWPLPELGGRTTLQAAEIPNLDRMARQGIVGLAQTVPDGVEPSSAAACTSILGYDPVADFVGRGAVEAASMGIVLGPDETAMRLNLVTVEKDMMRSYSAGHIPTEQSHAIVAELSEALDDDTFRLYPGVAYRHILVVKGHPELLDVQYSLPHDISDRHVAEHLPAGRGADLLLDYMSRAHGVLEGSNVNRRRESEGLPLATDVWPFWPGVTPEGMVPFEKARGLRAAMSSGVDLLNGLAVLLDIDRLEIPGVTDGPDNDYAAQAMGALKALKDHELVVVHVESPDEAAHAGDASAKIAAIEAIDAEIVSRLLVHDEPIRVLAMPDHPTPVGLKTHCGEAVPFLIHGLDVKGNGARGFNEPCASATELLLDPGRGVMGLLLAG